MCVFVRMCRFVYVRGVCVGLCMFFVCVIHMLDFVYVFVCWFVCLFCVNVCVSVTLCIIGQKLANVKVYCTDETQVQWNLSNLARGMKNNAGLGGCWIMEVFDNGILKS